MDPLDRKDTAAPGIGDCVYVDDIDLCYGTFVAGGRATVSKVWTSGKDVYIAVEEEEGTSWLWTSEYGLGAMQEELRLRRPEKAGRTMIRKNDGTVEPFGS